MRFTSSLRKMAKLFANSGDSDQTSHSAASDLGLHCLPITLLLVSRQQWVKVSQYLEKIQCVIQTLINKLIALINRAGETKCRLIQQFKLKATSKIWSRLHSKTSNFLLYFKENLIDILCESSRHIFPENKIIYIYQVMWKCVFRALGPVVQS